jgi:hypothetical protein
VYAAAFGRPGSVTHRFHAIAARFRTPCMVPGTFFDDPPNLPDDDHDAASAHRDLVTLGLNTRECAVPHQRPSGFSSSSRAPVPTGRMSERIALAAMQVRPPERPDCGYP